MSGQIIAASVVAIFFAHMFENVGMCTLIMPVTGIPLPLISYSGTFVVTCMFMLGLVQSVWVHRRLPSSKLNIIEIILCIIGQNYRQLSGWMHGRKDSMGMPTQ